MAAARRVDSRPLSMAKPSRPARSHGPVGRALVGGSLFVLAAFAAIPSSGCSRHDDHVEQGEDGGGPPSLDASRKDAADARDARSDEELAAIRDAGRFCGEKGLSDCPLQLWMKQNATPILTFGETTTLAQVFDEIALLAPPAKELTGQSFASWASIAHDGAAASRMGSLQAAKAACRGCHSQYSARYHADFRGLALSLPAAGDAR
jgi:hypothetical protein